MISKLLSIAYFNKKKMNVVEDEIDAAFRQNWQMINTQRKSSNRLRIVPTGKLGVLTIVKGGR